MGYLSPCQPGPHETGSLPHTSCKAKPNTSGLRTAFCHSSSALEDKQYKFTHFTVIPATVLTQSESQVAKIFFTVNPHECRSLLSDSWLFMHSYKVCSSADVKTLHPICKILWFPEKLKSFLFLIRITKLHFGSVYISWSPLLHTVCWWPSVLS